MYLNGITCVSYVDRSAVEVEFVLSGTTLEDALALGSDDLTLEDVDGTSVKVWTGYDVTGVFLDDQEDGLVHAVFARALDPQTAGAIKGLEDNMQIMRSDLAGVADESSAMQAQLDALSGKSGESV